MHENSLVYLWFFLSAALLVLGGYQYYAKDKATQNKINRRMSLIDDMSNPAAVLEILRRERGLGGGMASQRFQSLEDLFVQSGVRLRDTRFILSVAGLACGLTAALIYFLGFALYTLPLSVGLTFVLLYWWISQRRAKRITRFAEQLPDVLDIICRSLKAGHPLPVALSLVGREMQDPAGTEFGIASDEVTFGLDLTTAMWNLSKRVGAPDFLFVVTSISVHSQSGGNLGEVLARLSKLIRERFRMRRKVISLTSEGRMSALVLTALPIVLFFAIGAINPPYFRDVWNVPAFQKAMSIGIVLVIVGNVIMRKMVNFKY